jgi:type IV pilus assembly protein PilA
MRRARGFTLIEVMIAVGIVAILALMMVPTYYTRVVREQIVETLPLADLAKKPVAASWTLLKAFPPDNAAAGLPPAEKIVGNFVASVTVEAGAVHVRFGNRANARLKGKVLTWRPAVVEDAPVVPVAWVCGFAAVPGQMAAKGPNRTDVPQEYLPVGCRF